MSSQIMDKENIERALLRIAHEILEKNKGIERDISDNIEREEKKHDENEEPVLGAKKSSHQENFDTDEAKLEKRKKYSSIEEAIRKAMNDEKETVFVDNR